MILNDVCEFIVDTEHKTAPNVDIGIPSIRTPNVGKGRLILDKDIKYVDEQTFVEWTRRGIPQKGDLIIAREAPVGNVALVPDIQLCLGQRTVLVRPDNSMASSSYLCYYLLSPKMQYKMLAGSGGSTVAHLNMKDIRNLELEEIPPLSTQLKIASILSAYDDLIENNLKRIKLLEEQLAIKYSLLENNCKHNTESNFSDFVTFAKGVEPGSNNYLSQELEDSIPFIRVGDLSKRESNIWIERIKSKSAICDENDILISMDGTVGVVKYGINGCYSSGIRKAVSNGILNNAFIFCYLTSKTVQSVIYAHSKGSTIQHAGSSINYFKIRLPKKDELTNFINYSNSVFSMLLSLHKQNTKLREARDILLPRLMSGQIEV